MTSGVRVLFDDFTGWDVTHILPLAHLDLVRSFCPVKALIHCSGITANGPHGFKGCLKHWNDENILNPKMEFSCPQPFTSYLIHIRYQ